MAQGRLEQYQEKDDRFRPPTARRKQSAWCQERSGSSQRITRGRQCPGGIPGTQPCQRS